MIMQDIVEQDQGQEKNELLRGHNGNTGRNQAPRSFIKPGDQFMLLEEFAYHLQLFRRLSEDHLFRQVTSS